MAYKDPEKTKGQQGGIGMIGILSIESGDFCIRYQDQKFPILEDEFYKWIDLYHSKEGIEVEVEFDIEAVDYFDQQTAYAKFITYEH